MSPLEERSQVIWEVHLNLADLNELNLDELVGIYPNVNGGHSIPLPWFGYLNLQFPTLVHRRLIENF